MPNPAAMAPRQRLRRRLNSIINRLSAFYADLHADYPTAKTLYVAQDNWPVHLHPDVLARLAPQTWPYPFNVPANWSTQPSKKAVQDELPIQILCLPTYASWCNPNPISKERLENCYDMFLFHPTPREYLTIGSALSIRPWLAPGFHGCGWIFWLT